MSALDAAIIEIECDIVKKFDGVHLFFLERIKTIFLSTSTISFTFGCGSPSEY
jgi:hypothetical protein